MLRNRRILLRVFFFEWGRSSGILPYPGGGQIAKTEAGLWPKVVVSNPFWYGNYHPSGMEFLRTSRIPLSAGLAARYKPSQACEIDDGAASVHDGRQAPPVDSSLYQAHGHVNHWISGPHLFHRIFHSWIGDCIRKKGFGLTSATQLDIYYSLGKDREPLGAAKPAMPDCTDDGLVAWRTAAWISILRDRDGTCICHIWRTLSRKIPQHR